MICWRIATETRQYRANDLSGKGAASNPGRWNSEGETVVYAAEHRSLAVLETAAHLDSDAFPMNRFLVEIDIPDELWAQRETTDPATLSPAWAAIPFGMASVEHGSAWWRSQRSLILLVPSVIVPEEQVVLIHAEHPDAARVTAKTVRPFAYDRLFRGGR